MTADAPLAGLHLWLTRPEGRGTAAARTLRAAGARVREYPVLAIAPTGDAAMAETRRLWLDPAGWDWRIFASPAAVAAVRAWPLPPGLAPGALAAVGPATARAVETTLGAACLAGPGTTGADGLLALPEFAPARVEGRCLLLLQGEGGREALAPVLLARGGRPAVARLYRRVALPLALAPGDWPEGLPQALTLSSTDLARAVAAAARAAGAEWVFTLGQIAWSERVREVARAEGFRGPCVTLAADEDPERALLAACLALRGAASGPGC
jgi:uroporphyrinogen-III synthase